MVRHLRRQPAALADGDGVAHAVEHARGLVAHVRLVDAAELAGDARQLHHLFERRVVAGHVEEARAQPERAFAHAGPDQLAHPLELLGRGHAVRLADDAPRAPSRGR